MIDQIYDREGEDVPLEVAMINALGYVNGTKVTSAIVEKNPSFKSQTTRFEILSHISEVAAKKGIFIHPDVHTSKAQWCCSHTDGNAWFGDKYFDIDRWLRGLKYVAHWAEAHDNVVSMSLRNELRESWNVTGLYYNWETFVGNMTRGADAIHEANPDLLITWSGLQYDQDLSALTSGKNLLTAPCYRCTAIRDALRRKPQYFDLDAHPWKDKLVWELHLYSGSEDIDTGTCEMIEAALYRNGFNALGISQPSGCNITNDCPPALRETPVIFSEFGHAQRPDMQDDVLQSCIKQFTQKHDISWMVWSLAGSFRIRSGVQGMEDTWGLTTADWSNWRFGEGIDRYWRPWVEYMNVTRRV